ncbi:hypothetical protein [Arthrobacter mobilis]|uniref:Uncharacterized protein n=1 Tax=Arthrobacter mobilis TaxID=2724944 RepID=A0A7X6HCG5_9MICC|nr:hypothetical protein [Arthrobacter mobilis]NKX54574.1 hypothetical protein [Arthrobacter mobilis]
MKPHIETNTLPLSIANVDSTVYLDLGTLHSPEVATRSGSSANLSPAQEHMLAAVACRAGEVEAAEWALDQAQASCGEQIVAALSSGLPAGSVAEAAGVSASALAKIVAAQAPRAG